MHANTVIVLITGVAKVDYRLLVAMVRVNSAAMILRTQPSSVHLVKVFRPICM